MNDPNGREARDAAQDAINNLTNSHNRDDTNGPTNSQGRSSMNPRPQNVAHSNASNSTATRASHNAANTNGDNNNNSNNGGSRSNRNGDHDMGDAVTQDNDFQSQDGVVIRPRAGGGADVIPDPQPQNSVTEESTCSICFEVWTNSGPHRLVSIRCGHLFGESCIMKWILGGSSKCPECNQTSKRKDIRRIWSKAVVVVDTAEREHALSTAKNEQQARIKSEQALADSKMAFEALKAQMLKLQKKHDRQKELKQKYRQETKRLRLTNPQDDINNIRFTYQFKNSIPVVGQSSKTQTYISVHQNEEMIVLSQQKGYNYGLSRISMRHMNYPYEDFIPIHTNAIRDVQCYGYEPFANVSLVLTASHDKTLKITSVSTRQTVVSYDLGAQVWSCCWSSTNPFQIYAACKGKESSIVSMDMRQTKSFISQFSDTELLGFSPIHSLTHIGSSRQNGCEGILCGNLLGAFVFNWNPNASDPLTTGMISGACNQISPSQENLGDGTEGSGSSIQGGIVSFKGASCSSVAYDPASQQWMASYKSIGQAPTTQHVRGTVEKDGIVGNYTLRSHHKVNGGQPVPYMSRSSLFSRADGSVNMVAGYEDYVLLWQNPPRKRLAKTLSSLGTSLKISTQPNSGDEETLKRIKIPLNPPSSPAFVRDIKPVVVDDEEYIAVLTKSNLQLFRWGEVAEGSNDSDDESAGSDDEDAGGNPRDGNVNGLAVRAAFTRGNEMAREGGNIPAERPIVISDEDAPFRGGNNGHDALLAAHAREAGDSESSDEVDGASGSDEYFSQNEPDPDDYIYQSL